MGSIQFGELCNQQKKDRSTNCNSRKGWAITLRALLKDQFPGVSTSLIPCALFISGQLEINIVWKADKWIHRSIVSRRAGFLGSK